MAKSCGNPVSDAVYGNLSLAMAEEQDFIKLFRIDKHQNILNTHIEIKIEV
jgi:hypothetical protein